MSNILKDKNTFSILNDFLVDVQKSGVSTGNIEFLLNSIIPKSESGDLLIKHRVTNKGFNTAIFLPQCERIDISIAKLEKWLELNATDFSSEYRIQDLRQLRSYLTLFVITHELEHGYEYFMGKKVIESPCLLVSEGYKGLFDLFKDPNYIIPRPIKQTRRTISLILYKLHQNEYLLERNANIEACDLLVKLAQEKDDQKMSEIFMTMKEIFLLQGYFYDSEGSLSETYRKILMHDKYKKINHDFDLSMEERIRYGLEIDEETRKHILAKAKKQV